MNYAYCTLLTRPEYIEGVNNLYYTWSKFSHKYPFIVIVTDNISESDLATLIPCNRYTVPYKKFKVAMSYYEDVINKFYLYDLVQYDKIMFLDADVLVLNNLDSLLEDCSSPTFSIKRCLSYCFIVDPKLFTSNYLFSLCDTEHNEERLFRRLYTNVNYISGEKLCSFIEHIGGLPKYWLDPRYKDLKTPIDAIFFITKYRLYEQLK